MKKNGSQITRSSKNLWSALIIGAIILLINSVSFAQLVGRPDRGYQAGNSYSISDIENVNLSGGNVLMNIPLASLPAGRGTSPGGSISLTYDSKLWNTDQEWKSDGTNEFGGQADYTRNLLEQAPDGGWHIYTSYRLNIVDRNESGHREKCFKGNSDYNKNSYRLRVEIQTPGGGSMTFRPAGYNDFYKDGFFEVDLNGYIYEERYAENFQGDPVCQYNPHSSTTAGMTYYSTDGFGIRLFVPYNSAYLNQSLNGDRNWTMYFPDGKTIENRPPNDTSVLQRTTDRNGNYVVVKAATVNGVSGAKIEDQLGRFIFAGRDTNGDDKIIQSSVSGEQLETTIKWKDTWIYRKYKAVDITPQVNIPADMVDAEIKIDVPVVDKIILPAQASSLTYEFTYHGADTEPAIGAANYTDGWGELASVKLPSAAVAEYVYNLPANENPLTTAMSIIKNSITQKKLKYNVSYDGQTPQQQTDTWVYAISGGAGSVAAPDGSATSQNTVYKIPSLKESQTTPWNAGLVYRTNNPDGSKVERIWEQKGSSASAAGQPLNPYVKTEFTTITDAAGQPTLTAIKDYLYDQNMNVLEIREYDWVTYCSVPRTTTCTDNASKPTGIPSGATLKRVTKNEYYNPALPMTSPTYNANYYADPSAPKLLNLIKSTEVQNAAGTPVSRTEFTYDSTTATGNLTQVKTWDSAKNGTSQPYSNPLTASNSVSVTTAYDAYGNPTLITDAKSVQTQITYGAINGYSGLYPTQTVAAYGTSIARTSTAVYDFSTGLVTSATDVDNSVTNATTYDALGRPTKAAAAVGTPLEIWTQTVYDDINRRVIVKADVETKGDAKKVATQFYDQLGRVRLSKALEDAATQSATNETDGIKVQTRYLTRNPDSYAITSNPYRANYSSNAGAEPSMGWTRSKSWNTGKKAETETFSGAALPAPFAASNANTSSTGVVKTDTDADRTLVTDQAGKQRMSQTNALGQLTNVWEIKAAEAGQTEAISFGSPALSLNGLKTSYSYDTLNNLTTVIQGTQPNRNFAYSSLARLLSAQNPESGTIAYQYDNNGNLTQKTDARSITTAYTYDALNRVTFRDYSDATPDVTYTYDNLPNAKGKLTKVTTGTSPTILSITDYQAFDKLGRVTQSQQTTDGTAYPAQTYVYNLSGALIEEKYPSGRVVKNVLDADGDLSTVQSKKNATAGYWNYAKSFTYTAAGAVSSMQLGNGRWESTLFNSRLQPVQIALGTVQNGSDKLKLNFDYGAATNNGNVLSQQITVPTLGQATGFTATQNYTYDELNRLQSATETTPNQMGWKQTFKYDRYGNRNFDTSVSGNTTTLAANCITAVCNPTVDPLTNKLVGSTFDDAGNTKIDATGRQFTYDGENKQTEVKSSGNSSIGQYFYDGDGKRVKKVNVQTGETTIFIYDASGRMVAEYSTTVEPVSTAQVSYLTSDNLGTPRINTDANGAVMARHDYMPFGEEIDSAITAQRNINYNYGGDAVRQKFTSYERDIETNLDFAIARYFGSSLGRFTSPDPLAESANPIRPQSWNRYSYSYNNPLRFNDPTGMIPEWVQKDGEVFYDSRVVDQQSATEIYGEGATYRPNGDQYTASDQSKVELGDLGFFKQDGVIKTNGDRAEDALKNQSVDHSGSVMMGGLAIAGGLAADDVTGIGVADDPVIPVIIAGAAVTALLIKAAHEIGNIVRKPPGPQGVQYSLRATTTGAYTCFTCSTGTMNLNTGDVWKYGETINPTSRYSNPELGRMGGLPVEQINEFSGSQVEIKVAEKAKIYSYFLVHQHLPPGNKIFR